VFKSNKDFDSKISVIAGAEALSEVEGAARPAIPGTALNIIHANP
jgi:hypothetical protein